MPRNEECFRIGRILNHLGQSIGESEFGYRAQALFAHVLLRLGGVIVEIKAQGHPDIIAGMSRQTLLIQVKSILPSRRHRRYTLGTQDLEGIHPPDLGYQGLLALLDCAPPVSWIVVDYHRLCKLGRNPVSLVTLRAMADRQLSLRCTEEFVKLISIHGERLGNLTFHVLRSRALQGEAL